MRRPSSKAVLSAARGSLRAALLVAVCSIAFSPGEAQSPEPGTLKPGTPKTGTPEAKTVTDLLLRDASRLYQARKFEDAAAKYQAALAQDPHSAEAYAGITRCYLKAGKMHEPKQVTLTFKGDKLRIAKVGEDETTSWRRPSRSTRLKSPRR